MFLKISFKRTEDCSNQFNIEYVNYSDFTCDNKIYDYISPYGSLSNEHHIMNEEFNDPKSVDYMRSYHLVEIYKEVNFPLELKDEYLKRVVPTLTEHFKKFESERSKTHNTPQAFDLDKVIMEDIRQNRKIYEVKIEAQPKATAEDCQYAEERIRQNLFGPSPDYKNARKLCKAFGLNSKSIVDPYDPDKKNTYRR